jgi:hypothetical protein
MKIMEMRKLCSSIFLILSIILFIFSLIAYISYKTDILHLRSIVRTNISTETSPRVFESINHWVYENKGFKKNPDYFLFKSLGPTPLQVLKQGGDCTDKSILLMAMLESIGIDSTLVMLYGEDGSTPTHTVVEVRDGQFKAVADPVYDLVFPNQNGGFYSIGDLRENPARLLNRLDNLIQSRGPSNKIALYQRANESYQSASPINWNKNDSLKLVSSILGGMGVEARDIRRPHFLDDPKLFVSTLLCFIGFISFVFAFIFKAKAKQPIKRK